MSLDLLSAQNLLEKISKGEAGWQGLNQESVSEAQQIVSHDALLKNFETADLYKQCFGTPAGQKVLQDLLDKTVFLATMPFNLGMDQATSHGLFREGQNSMVMEILKYLTIAKNGPPKAPR